MSRELEVLAQFHFADHLCVIADYVIDKYLIFQGRRKLLKEVIKLSSMDILKSSAK